MKIVTKLAFAAAGALALSATAASAEIVCNGEGECWHVREHVEYKPEFGVRVHPDNWKWRESEHYKWREHAGRGYWRNGIWIDIH
jgi:hypothetical protein